MAQSSEPLYPSNSFETNRIFPKKRKRLVGLLNQGGTCYLNSLLQTLFHTPEFNYRLFNLTTTANLGSLKSIIREMLRLFYCLMTYKKYAISSKSLTDSFGWSDQQVFVHQDVQELNRLLFEEIEVSLKNTVEANLINDLYKGVISTKIQCLRCGYRSDREDVYLDVNLAVIEHDSVEKCLQAHTSVERLDGENQYFCEKCNRKVDAVKATYFKEYPPILTLCLSRFDFDPNTMESIKVDKCCSFPLILDVSNFMEVRQKQKILYDLFSIVIHIGNSTLGGHYHAYIKDPYGFEQEAEDNENNKGETKSVSCNTIEGNVSYLDQVKCNTTGDTADNYFIDHFDNESLAKVSDNCGSVENLTVIEQSADIACDVCPSHRSSSQMSKKSLGKFSAIFDAIKNFWSGSNISTNTLSDTFYATSNLNETSYAIPHIAPFKAVVTEQINAFNRTISTSSEDFSNDYNNPINSNNNETVENWKSQIFDSGQEVDYSLKTLEVDYDKSNPNTDSKSSATKTNNSRSLLSTQNRMKFQSDLPSPVRNESDKYDNKLIKSEYTDKRKGVSTFIEKGKWFDFNDETITEIDPADFQRVYQGQECAYMLFYRYKNLIPPN